MVVTFPRSQVSNFTCCLRIQVGNDSSTEEDAHIGQRAINLESNMDTVGHCTLSSARWHRGLMKARKKVQSLDEEPLGKSDSSATSGG